VLADVLNALAEEQTWSNFKNETAACGEETGRAYIGALHELWLVMCKLQRPGAARRE